MIGAKLDRADLDGADLHGADLSEATMVGTKIRFPADDLASALECQIDFETYQVSGWDLQELEAWIDAGAKLIDREKFPTEVVEELESAGEGLTLFFRSPLEPFDRFLVDALIFSVLGPETLTRAIEVLPLDNRGFVRILGPVGEELFTLGDAIAGSIWRTNDPPHLAGLIRLPEIYDALERLAVRLERVQLRSPRGQTIPLSEGASPPPPVFEAKPGARPLTTVRTWRF